MSERCYYDILGVGRDSDEKSLKSAFRKQAMKFHPDRNGGCEESAAKFKEASEAFDILSDPDKRRVYDQFGRAGLNGGAGGPGGPGGRSDEAFRDAFGDIFSEFFGAGRTRQRSGPARGADLRYDYSISLRDAFEGKQAEIAIPTNEKCSPCSGSGAAPGSTPDTCETCQGQGRVRVQQGFFTMERTCVRCQGDGKIVKNPCKSCSGRGTVRKERTLAITIPAGIQDGQRIRLTGEGEPGLRGGPAGDLYIFVAVEEHELFERDGQHLYTQASVPMATAALGGEIVLPTIDGGRIRVSIPEGALTGKRMRLKGKGMPSLRGGGTGDLYVEVFVETPSNLNAKQKQLLREFADSCSEANHTQSRNFMQQVKKFFDKDDDGDSAVA